MKKITSLFMSIVMLLSITAGINLTANAQMTGISIIKDNYEYYIINDESVRLIRFEISPSADENVVVPSIIDGRKVTELGNDFITETSSSNRNLFYLTLPEHLEKFGRLPSVKGFIISENNKNFSTVDGVLYNKDKTVLVKYPYWKEATDYTVLNTVKTIGKEAFRYCANLNNVVMQDGVETIGEHAFSFFGNNYPTITIPKTLKTIEKGAFDIYDEYCPEEYNTKEIPTIIYDGTALEFAKMYDKTKDPECIRYYYYLDCKQPSKLDDFRFQINSEKKEITIYQYFGKLSSVVIPSTVDDYKVTTLVPRYLFKDNDAVKKVTIGSNISKIMDGYDENSSIFYDSKIEEIVVSKSNKTFSSLDGVLFNKKRTKLIAYPPAKKCKSYKVPSSVIKIGKYAFYGIKKTSNVVIPAKTKYIEPNAFYKSISLKSFSVSSKNKYFSAKDGVLFNKKKTTLLSYPISKTTKTYIVPRSVKTIDNYAIDHCKYLTAVKIPKSVKCIEMNFRDCKKLKKVYYAGSKSDWSKIKYHNYQNKYVSYGKNYRISGLKVHFNAKF